MGFHSMWPTNKATDLFIFFSIQWISLRWYLFQLWKFQFKRRVITKIFLSQMISILTCLINETKTLKPMTPRKLKRDDLYLERFLGKIVIWNSVFKRRNTGNLLISMEHQSNVGTTVL